MARRQTPVDKQIPAWSSIMPFILSGRSRQAATISARTGGGIPGLCRVMDVELSTELAFTSIAPEDLKPQSLAALTIARMPALIASGSSSGQVVAELGLGDVAAIQTA